MDNRDKQFSDNSGNDDSDLDTTFFPSDEERHKLSQQSSGTIRTRSREYVPSETQSTEAESGTADAQSESHVEPENKNNDESSPVIDRSQRASHRSAEKHSRKMAYLREKRQLDEQEQGAARPTPPERDDIQVNKKPRNYSFIWKHVTVVSGKNKHGKEVMKNKCRHCDALFSKEGGSTSATRKHLFANHYGKIDPKDLGDDDDMDQDNQRQVKPRRSLNTYIHKTGDHYPRSHPVAKDGDRMLGMLIVRDLRPLSDCNSVGMANLINVFDRNYNMPSPETLRTNVLVPMFHETRSAIKRILDPINALALTCDGWTSIADHSYITVTSHAIDKDCKLRSFVLDTVEMKKSHTSENLLTEIQSVLCDWHLENKHITFVSDNASDIKHALKDLGMYQWLGCGGHNLNLIALEGTKVPQVQTIIAQCKNIVNFLKKSTVAMYQLQKFQELDGLPPLSVIQECKTRWWSMLLMLQKILVLWSSIASTLVKVHKPEFFLSDTQIDQIKAIIDVLKPLKYF